MVAIRWAVAALVISVICASPVLAGDLTGAGTVAGDGTGGLVVAEAATAGAASDDAAVSALEDGADLSPAFLDDVAHVKAGRKLWKQQCRHCHGRAAYPGKAPKLKPDRYEPAFVFDRITNGFGKMPPWKHVFTATQRSQLVAYILSNRFSP